MVVKIGRVGWLAKGLVYLIAGILALSIALSASGWSNDQSVGGEEASPTGAIKTVADAAGGALLLWLLAVGMFLYAAWRVVSALLPGSTDATAMARRFGYVVSAILYGVLAVSAVAIARQPADEPNGNQTVTDLSADVMSHNAGRLLIGVVGVIVIIVGLYRMSKGFKLDVADELNLGSMSSTRRLWLQRLGAVGEIGRGIGIALVGFFLARSALNYDAGEATGLDGALRRLAAENVGVVIVAIVGIGFAAYGLFCIATFTHRRFERLG